MYPRCVNFTAQEERKKAGRKGTEEEMTHLPVERERIYKRIQLCSLLIGRTCKVRERHLWREQSERAREDQRWKTCSGWRRSDCEL